jgi:hypothetical protein
MYGVTKTKKLVKERDGRCVDCGSESLLEVHRLVPGSKYTVEGCVTLCEDCHAKRHRLLRKQGGKMAKTTFLVVRMTEEEKAMLSNKADGLGLTMSGLVLTLLNVEPDRVRVPKDRVRKSDETVVTDVVHVEVPVHPKAQDKPYHVPSPKPGLKSTYDHPGMCAGCIRKGKRKDCLACAEMNK